ncbi:MAG: flagellar motor switch protein FliN [Planctomycetota bacterium]|nr:flagellar motor switch protein FliN [Planctomycetota bacterium]
MTDPNEIDQQADVTEAVSEVAQAGAEAVEAAVAAEASEVQPVSFGELGPGEVQEEQRNLNLLLDVQIPVAVEVGRTQMSLEDVLKLVPGSVVPLDKKAEEAVDLRVNGKLVARGEVVLVDDCYGLRITQIVDTASRIESLR